MFQSKEYILKKHGQNGTDRAYYLKQLTEEYKKTDKQEAKQQVLANLANFAYDPINFNMLWDLQVVDLFLEATTSKDPLLQEFGMGGLANICLEKRHYGYITSKASFINDIKNCIDPTFPSNTIVNAMTTLIQLITEENYTGNFFILFL
ncbi:hypothetical protein HPULCUR_008266 [Helicostylum pulchrum]|uniref:Uncharacterized protein n=1 Tax=Helicostylum pulchrum TaxID=562976 RepID=A0ABP9Y750_9FUNG